MSRYYDIDGNPLELMEWAALLEPRTEENDWWRIGHTTIGDARISTVWLGMDHNFLGDGPPLIFETMVFEGPADDQMEHYESKGMERYSTKEQAAEGHARWVAKVEEPGWGSGGAVVNHPCKPHSFSRFVPAGGVSLPDRTEPHRTANTGDHEDSGLHRAAWGRRWFAGLSGVWVGLWVGVPPKTWVGASQNEVDGCGA